MKLEQQVTSLEISKRLKELGVKQGQSYCVWIGKELWDSTMVSEFQTSLTPPKEKWIDAFTVAELGEMMPAKINIPFKNGKPRAVWNSLKSYFGKKEGEPWVNVYYAKPAGTNEYIATNAATEAEARGLMLINILENNLWKPS